MVNNENITGKKVWVAGHRGMVGSSIVRALQNEDCEIITASRSELDLRDRSSVHEWMQDTRPDIVILAAAKVGGIMANSTMPIDFLNDNLQIQDSVINASAAIDVSKLLFLGSSCIYPKFADQPIEESSLLTGPLEPTNEWYALAKIAGIKLCQAYMKQQGCNFISAMPTNLYGPNDNFDMVTSHVLPALMRKVHEAKMLQRDKIEVWGSGTPLREFMYVDDLASACLHLLKHYQGADPINVGSGQEHSISDLVSLICDVIGYEGRIVFDRSKPDGTPRKLLSSAKLNGLGWSPEMELRDGIHSTYQWFLENEAARIPEKAA